MSYFKRTFFIFILCNIFYLSISYAQDNEYLLQADTHKALMEIHKNMQSGKNEIAIGKLKTLLKSDNLKKYDAAIIYQTMGYAESGLSNFEASAKSFIMALSLDALPEKITHELNYTVAQLLIHVQKEKEGLNYLSKWFKNESSPKADAYILAATAHYQIKEYEDVISNTSKAISKNNTPPLNWHELLLAAYYELKNYKKAVEVLETIINKFPDKTEYWLQLASIYQQLKMDNKALAMYELAYSKQLLNKDEIVQLVKNYMYLEMPLKAAKLLEKEMAVGDVEASMEMLILLADGWILAHEYDKAKSVFHEVLKKYNDDRTRLRLGQLYIESEDWPSVINVLDIKLQTEDKIMLSKIKLLLGIAQFHLENLNGAEHSFIQALSDKSTEDQARWWLDHVRRKTETTQS